MKIRHSVTALLLAAAAVFGLTACGSRNDDVKNVSKPKTTATGDEVYTVPSDAVEESANVNGMRFNLSLYQFTANYNNERTSHGDKDILDLKKWEKNGESEKDGNGVYVQYWHYDEDDVSFTATVEVKSDKLVNIGCGTTMSNFMEMTGDVNNSDKILEKTAQMAQAACGFPPRAQAPCRIFSIAPPQAPTIRCGTAAMCSASAPRRMKRTAKITLCCSGCSPLPRN